MALTRKLLKSMGIEDEKIDQIIEAHVETTDALKSENAELKEKASKVDELQKSLNEATKTIEQAGKDAYKVKYEAIKEEFETFKNDINVKETKTNKTNAYKALLEKSGVSEKRIESILKISDIDSLELDNNGNLKDSDKLTESIKTEWADFIPTTTTQGAKVATPPVNNVNKTYSHDELSKMSASEINANWNSIKTTLNN